MNNIKKFLKDTKKVNILILLILFIILCSLENKIKRDVIQIDRSNLVDFTKLEISKNFNMDNYHLYNILETSNFLPDLLNFQVQLLDVKSNNIINVDLVFELDKHLNFNNKSFSIENNDLKFFSIKYDDNNENEDLLYLNIQSMINSFNDYKIKGFEKEQIFIHWFDINGNLHVEYFKNSNYLYWNLFLIIYIFCFIIFALKIGFEQYKEYKG